MKNRFFALSLALAAMLCALPPAAPAQGVGAAAGPAVPLGGLGEHRGIGVRGQLSLYSPGGLLRGDVAGMAFPGSDDAGASAWRTGTWRSVSFAGNLLPTLARPADGRVRGLVGLSAHRMSISGADNPYGTVPGAQLGGVVERSWKGATLTAELGLHLVASDFGVDEMHGSFSLPVMVGIRW